MLEKKKKTVGIYLEEQIIDRLKRISHIKSLEAEKNISYLDLIRESIELLLVNNKDLK